MKVKSPRTSRALLDVILSIMAMIILLIAPPTDGDVIARVDFVLEVAWNDHVDVDVDTWVMRPDNVKMSYRHKDTGHVSIDRDDLGNRNDPSIANIEVTNFREPMDGVYFVSIHNYRTTSGWSDKWVVSVVLKDVSGPAAQIKFAAIIPMPELKQETPVLMFRVIDGKIVDVQESHRRIVGASWND